MIPVRILSCLALVSATLCSCGGDSSTTPDTPTVISDDFSDSTASMGSFNSNNDPWKWSNGAISCRGNTQQSYLTRNDAYFRDGWVEATVDTVDDGGIAARVKDGRNLILLALHDNSGPVSYRPESRLQLWVVVKGDYKIIDSAAYDWPRGTPVKARLKVVGDTIEAWVNGVRKCRKIDSTIRDSGSIALRHLGSTSDTRWNGGTMISHYLDLRWQEL